MRIFASACSILFALTTSIHAQPGTGVRPYARPTFSPYLNLNRQNINPAINYYGLVRPQLRYNQSIQQLQDSTNQLQQQQQAVLVGSDLPPTGHSTGFLNHNSYFLNRGGNTPLSGRPVAASPATRPPTRSIR